MSIIRVLSSNGDDAVVFTRDDHAEAQALYLACSETERAFLALANRQRFLLTYSRD